jgi:hypothetical protein
MKQKIFSVAFALVLGLLFLVGSTGQTPVSHAQTGPDQPLDTAFTYQGFLVYQGSYYDGVCDFRFGLYNAPTGGDPIAGPISKNGVPVRNGYFTAKLDFGSSVIKGVKRWLQIAVSCPQTSESIILRPRQELTPVPHALALPGLWTQPGRSPNLIGGFFGNVVHDNVRGATIGGGGYANLPDADVPWPYPELNDADLVRTNNSGVNTVREAFGSIGGGLGNSSDLLAVVGGGAYNDADGPGGTVGGGVFNQAAGLGATATGGYRNAAKGNYTVIGGGQYNSAAADSSTIGGGSYNDTNHYGATISGGASNAAVADGSTVGGGGINTASGTGATIAGGGYNVANNFGATIGGGVHNRAGNAPNVVDPTRLDNFKFEAFPIDAQPSVEPLPFEDVPADGTLRGIFTTVAGGVYNIANGPGGTVGGGGVNAARGLASTVGGGYLNQSDGDYSTIPGGQYNDANGNGATVGGGAHNLANNYRSTVGGGHWNRAGNHIAPVDLNTLEGNFFDIFPDAANANDEPVDVDPVPVDPTRRGRYANVDGGAYNTAAGPGSSVGGGGLNTAAGLVSTIGGGYKNYAAGLYGTVPGGFKNSAQGSYSLAAGHQARANHQGAFVWADASTNSPVASTGANQFIVQAEGGLWFGADANPTIPLDRFINTSTGAYLSRSGTWTNNSDRNRKENFSAVDNLAVLEQLAEVPVTTWNYKVDDPTTRHMGPMAQDFYAAFGLGQDEAALSTLDTDGVALAAIQGLYQLNQAQAALIEDLQTQSQALEARIAALEALLNGSPVDQH